MNKPIIIIYGPNGSGKDTLGNALRKESSDGVIFPPQYTSRPSRKDDSKRTIADQKTMADDAFAKEYHTFINPNTGEKMNASYWFLEKDIDLSKTNIVYGISLDSVKGFIDKFGRDNLFLIKIAVTAYNRLTRMLHRASESGTKLDDNIVYEICTRILDNREQYKDTDIIPDLVLDNNGSNINDTIEYLKIHINHRTDTNSISEEDWK